MGSSSAAAATGDMTSASTGTPSVATAGSPPLDEPDEEGRERGQKEERERLGQHRQLPIRATSRNSSAVVVGKPKNSR